MRLPYQSWVGDQGRVEMERRRSENREGWGDEGRRTGKGGGGETKVGEHGDGETGKYWGWEDEGV